jgi:hypothetical protein
MDYEGMVAAAGAGLVAGLVLTVGVRFLRRLRSSPESSEVPLPREGSAARQPMVELAAEQSAMTEVLIELYAADVPEAVVERVWEVADDTYFRLRALASRLEGVELAAEHASPTERAALEDGAGGLLAQLVAGLDDYRELVAAAGRVPRGKGGPDIGQLDGVLGEPPTRP